MNRDRRSVAKDRLVAMIGIVLASATSLVLVVQYLPDTDVPEGAITALVVIQTGILATAVGCLVKDRRG